jgi:hypothetical protein
MRSEELHRAHPFLGLRFTRIAKGRTAGDGVRARDGVGDIRAAETDRRRRIFEQGDLGRQGAPGQDGR